MGQDAKALALMSATIASYLPFPGVGLVGDLALYAMGEQSSMALGTGIALGLIPGGKLLGKLGGFTSKLGASAWRSAKQYAGSFGGFVARGGKGLVGSLAAKARKWSDDVFNLGRAAKNRLADGPLDWSKADKRFDSRYNHVQNHGKDQINRLNHGVFDNDPVFTTEQAWAKARIDGVVGRSSGGGNIIYDVNMGSPVGWAGGAKESGAPLTWVRIIIDRSSGRNMIVTAFPR